MKLKDKDTSEFIEDIKTYCIYCDKSHEVELRKRKTITKIENDIVEYEAHFYKCINSTEDDTEFITQELAEDNFARALNIYKEKREETSHA